MEEDAPRETPGYRPHLPLRRGFGRRRRGLGPIPFALVGDSLVRQSAGIRDLSEELLSSELSRRYPVPSIVARDSDVLYRLFMTGFQLSSVASFFHQFEFFL